jgi:hypothetical protein
MHSKIANNTNMTEQKIVMNISVWGIKIRKIFVNLKWALNDVPKKA